MEKEKVITIQLTKHQLELIEDAMEVAVFNIGRCKDDLKSFLDDEEIPKENRVLCNGMMQDTLNELSENKNLLNIIKEKLK